MPVRPRRASTIELDEQVTLDSGAAHERKGGHPVSGNSEMLFSYSENITSSIECKKRNNRRPTIDRGEK